MINIIIKNEINKFFTSDTHLGHKKVLNIQDRGKYFKSLEEHDRYILDRINSLVKKGDELYILGDFAFYNLLEYRKKIKCSNVKFIRGNHDVVSKLRKASQIGKYDENLDTYEKPPSDYFLRDIFQTKIKGHRTTLCHYPMVSWPASNYGSFLLFGHEHSNTNILDKIHLNRRCLDVGIDMAKILLGEYDPFSEDFIYKHLIKKTIHQIG